VTALSTVIARGTIGSRPAAGNAGRLYFSTEPKTYRDNGSSWDDVSDTASGSGVSAFAAAVKAFYAQHATNGTSDVVTISAASSGDRIIVVTSSRGRDVNTPTCTNVTFTEVLAVNFSTTIYLSVYVGVVAGGASGTTVTTTATGSNFIIQDVYVISDTLTPTAGTPASLTNTSASAVANTMIGPITCSAGDFVIFAATDDDGSTSITSLVASTPLFSNPLGTNVALRSAIGRAGGSSVVGYYLGGTAGSDLAAGIVAVT
jgi:hypothetical protein